MPSGEVHAAIGAGVAGFEVWRDVIFHPLLTHIPATMLVLGVAVIGSLLPDIDLPQSMLGRFVPWFSWLPGVKHRGITHRLRWAPLLGFVVFGVTAHWLLLPLAAALGIAATAGFLSHLVADRHLRI